jgi:hypothetical protein
VVWFGRSVSFSVCFVVCSVAVWQCGSVESKVLGFSDGHGTGRPAGRGRDRFSSARNVPSVFLAVRVMVHDAPGRCAIDWTLSYIQPAEDRLQLVYV